ncbi:MAG: glycine zipper 2TM domain-containing protein [Pirellulaceae bacterium]|nr:glycine zipper 2TM domain-containing protein [Pirellulaceae bacterium]
MLLRVAIVGIGLFLISASTAEAQSFKQQGTRRGAVVGGIVGGLIGAKNDRPAAGIITGAVVGGLVGREVGRNRDNRYQGPQWGPGPYQNVPVQPYYGQPQYGPIHPQYYPPQSQGFPRRW